MALTSHLALSRSLALSPPPHLSIIQSCVCVNLLTLWRKAQRLEYWISAANWRDNWLFFFLLLVLSVPRTDISRVLFHDYSCFVNCPALNTHKVFFSQLWSNHSSYPGMTLNWEILANPSFFFFFFSEWVPVASLISNWILLRLWGGLVICLTLSSISESGSRSKIGSGRIGRRLHPPKKTPSWQPKSLAFFDIVRLKEVKTCGGSLVPDTAVMGKNVPSERDH